MKPGYLITILLLWVTINTHAQQRTKSPGSIPQTGDEFTGPFNSWLNAKKGFGATGDGVTDDTAALQAAIDAAATGNGSSTLYLAPGVYRITRTLIINYRINISIIGADPATTIIKWGGAAHGTMMQINGTAYSRFNRICWNGNKDADVAVEQSWDAKKPNFDTGNEYADDIFTDVGFGIHGGGLGHGFAETSILRDRFIRNSVAAVSLGNFNALDIWIRNCLFQDCATGVTNTYGAGNFRLYQNVFLNSTKADISINNTGGFSIRGNTSVNSARFFYAADSSNPATIIIEGNTVIDPVSNQAITVGNQGPVIFINNTIRSRAATGGGPVALFKSTTFSMGNRFTVPDPIAADSNISYNNQVVPLSSLKGLTVPALPGVEPCFSRKIFEVPPGANATAIQAIINQAVRVSGTRPVVHFPYGKYLISETLFVPANTDIQLAGDGYGMRQASLLEWNGTGTGPLIAIAGPGKATLRDLTLSSNPAVTNILVTNADQPGSRVFLQEFNQKSGQTGLLANQLDHTVVFAYDIQFSGLKKAVSIIGGPQAAAGKPAGGRVIIYSGAESNNNLSHEVSNGGNLTVQDSWYEGDIKSTFVKLSGKGIFTSAGNHIYTPHHTNVPSVSINDFSGTATFIADDLTDRFAITGNGSSSKILALGLLTEDDPAVADTSSPKADIRMLFNRTRDYHPNLLHRGSLSLPDIGTYDQAYIRVMLTNMLNIHPAQLTALPAGVTDLRIYRVMSIGGAIGVDIEPRKTP